MLKAWCLSMKKLMKISYQTNQTTCSRNKNSSTLAIAPSLVGIIVLLKVETI